MTGEIYNNIDNGWRHQKSLDKYFTHSKHNTIDLWGSQCRESQHETSYQRVTSSPWAEREAIKNCPTDSNPNFISSFMQFINLLLTLISHRLDTGT